MAARIPATVITGFLGAGKTTLIRHLLANAGGRRIALVINEFGDLGVDGEILRGCGDVACRDEDMIELSNGCICCTVADDFLPTMTRLVERDSPPEHIVIETSGLALPQPLLRAFNWPGIRARVTVDGVVAVVDGPAAAEGRFAADVAAVDRQRAADDSLDHATPLAELFEDQLAAADMIVVNKTDLMDAPGAAALAAALGARSRAGVQVVAAAQGAVDPAVLLGLGIGAEDDLHDRAEVHHHDHGADAHHDHDPDDSDDHTDEGHDHHDDHGHDAFASVVVDLPELDAPDRLVDAVRAAIATHGLLRVKGFATVAGRPMRMVLHAVGPRVDTHYDRALAPGEARATRLVAIGSAGLDGPALSAALTAALSAEPVPAL